MWYKTEANTASEYAGKILYDHGLTPIYVSDNPVLNAQHVLFEAAKGYRYGLPYHAALASVTTAPAERLGFGKRLGKIKHGFDADVVVWDSDPLSVGASPVQVWIDGTAQFKDPVELEKPPVELIKPDESLQNIPEGLVEMDEVVFTGLSKVLLADDVKDLTSNNTVIMKNGRVTCIGSCESELHAASKSNTPIINLNNGYLTESFTAFGSKLGLNAIDAEDDTDNGPSGTAFTRAEDGLALDTQKTNVAFSYGVTKAVSAPKLNDRSTHHGISVGFSTGAKTPLDKHAVFFPDVGVHYTLDLDAKSNSASSISSAISTLRTKLLSAASPSSSSNSNTTESNPFSEPSYLHLVLNGTLPLVITVHSADTIAAVLKLKTTVEAFFPGKTNIRLVLFGAAEAHLLSKELAAANVGVVLAPIFSYAKDWDQRRALSGAPLTNGTGVDRLLDAGVLVGIGLEEDWVVRDLGLLAGWVWQNGEGRVESERRALELVGGNLWKMLGVKVRGEDTGAREPRWREGHFVVWEGSPLGIGGRVKAVGGGGERVSVWG